MKLFSAVHELLFPKAPSDTSTVLSVFLITTRKFKDFFHFVPCSDCSWRTKWVDLFKDGGSKRILSLQPRDKVNMLCDERKNYKFLLRSLHEKRLVPRGGKPVILWPLFVPCEQRFISGMAFSTCGVVYSVSVIRLVGFFFLQITTPFIPGPSCTKVLYIMGPVSLAFLWKHFIGEFSLSVFK